MRAVARMKQPHPQALTQSSFLHVCPNTDHFTPPHHRRLPMRAAVKMKQHHPQATTQPSCSRTKSLSKAEKLWPKDCRFLPLLFCHLSRYESTAESVGACLYFVWVPVSSPVPSQQLIHFKPEQKRVWSKLTLQKRPYMCTKSYLLAGNAIPTPPSLRPLSVPITGLSHLSTNHSQHRHSTDKPCIIACGWA